jgi:hypothetical protein
MELGGNNPEIEQEVTGTECSRMKFTYIPLISCRPKPKM